jgi:hypothetical protein
VLQVREAARVSGHDTKRFALREQVLNDNAAETATGPNDQYHIWFLSRCFHHNEGYALIVLFLLEV